jgi:hypothetical protein
MSQLILRTAALLFPFLTQEQTSRSVLAMSLKGQFRHFGIAPIIRGQRGSTTAAYFDAPTSFDQYFERKRLRNL